MKRRLSNFVAGIVTLVLVICALGFAASVILPSHIGIEGAGRMPDLSYRMGWDLYFGDGEIGIRNRDHDEHVGLVLEFVRPAILCAAYLFRWSGIPGKWHLLPRPIRKPTGFCGKCGYDLRASPERCPECGTTRSI